MNKGEIINFLDYEIFCCENGDGIVLRKQRERPQELWEGHLGNFDTKEDAMMAAVIFYMIARPEDFAQSIFLRSMGNYSTFHEYFLFKNSILREGYQMPSEITDCGTLNFMLRLNGKIIRLKGKITNDQLIDLCRSKLKDKTNKGRILEILRDKFNVRNVRSLPEESYLAFKKEIENLP